MSCFLRFAIIALITLSAGCAEGPFWRMGKYSPWVVKQWEAEEKVANTIFKTKREMDEMVRAALDGSTKDRDEAAGHLSEWAMRDSILLTRLHAIRLLAQLDCDATRDTLEQLSSDPVSEVRLAAIQSWEKLPAGAAVPALQRMLSTDTNVDVRLAATRALGGFPGEDSIRALNLALTDQDPAIQLRATESLAKATGQSFGRNVKAWAQYVEQTIGDPSAAKTATAPTDTNRR